MFQLVPFAFLGFAVDMSDWHEIVGRDEGWRATLAVSARHGVPLVRPIYVEVAIYQRDIDRLEQSALIGLVCNTIQTGLKKLALALDGP